MQAEYRVLKTEEIPHTANGRFALDILEGLCKSPKQTKPVYFYDMEGSRLYQRITDSADYYLTNCEMDILAAYGTALAERIGPGPLNLIELGSGDGRKTALLLKSFLETGLTFRYVPIDVSAEAMRQLTRTLERQVGHIGLEMQGLVAEYFDAVHWLDLNNGMRNAVLFLGSNIGNFDPEESRTFLRALRNSLNDGDYLLIGFDMKKDPAVIERAYDDGAVMNQEFNLNLLDRMNRELGANFERRNFIYKSYYNVQLGAVESWLVATRAHRVFIEELKREFSFSAWEGIRTEYSFKYTLDEIMNLAEETGFSLEKNYSDAGHGYFVDSLWRVTK